MSKKKVVGIIRPFDFKQSIVVYDNNNQIAATTSTLDDIEDTILSLCDEYDITEIDLTGSKQYNRGLKKKLQEAELNKYEENKMEINVI